MFNIVISILWVKNASFGEQAICNVEHEGFEAPIFSVTAIMLSILEIVLQGWNVVPGPKELPPTLDIPQDVREINTHTGNGS